VSAVLLPSPRQALRHPAVRAALLLVAAGPVWVAWLGERADAPVRLRVLGLALAVSASFAWDDRVHSLTAPTPVGLPAVRRGRALVVLPLLVLAFAVGVRAVPSDVALPVRPVALQTCAMAAVLLAVVGWVGRDGDAVLAVPVPAVMVLVALLYRLPQPVTMLHADPLSPAWPAERARWFVLLVVAAGVVAWWARDPAARRYRWRA
jgi:hypothetical protein